MNILVTGAAGFIGSHVVDQLLLENHQVTGLDNFDPFYAETLKRDNLASALKNKGFKLVEGDIRSFSLISSLFETIRPDAVIHLAARAGVRPSLEDPSLYMDVNVTGTTNIFEAARRLEKPPKVVYASSSSVYGDRETAPFRETEDVDSPISPYAASKRACEIIASTFHHLYGLPITGLRFFTAFGPRNRPDLAIAKFTKLILERKPIPVFGNGSTRRDYTYVSDISDGVVRAMHHCHKLHLYNLGNSHPIRLIDMIQTIGSATGVEPILEFQEAQPGDVNQTFADISLASHEIGFEPRTPFAEGIANYVRWYQEKNL
ncbi:MAG: GDP-mannose 4,6-dehydratase [bacterium]